MVSEKSLRIVMAFDRPGPDPPALSKNCGGARLVVNAIPPGRPNPIGPLYQEFSREKKALNLRFCHTGKYLTNRS